MKSKIKLLGIISLMLIIGITIIACGRIGNVINRQSSGSGVEEAAREQAAHEEQSNWVDEVLNSSEDSNVFEFDLSNFEFPQE